MFRAMAASFFYPGLLLGSMFTIGWGMAAGVNLTVVVALTIAGASLPILLMQHWMPYETSWKGPPKVFGIDLLHMCSTGASGEVLRALTFGVAFALAASLSTWWGANLWPQQWPIWCQIALALVIGDLGAYTVHRGCHEFPLLWRIHAMHHSSEQLYIFASGRNHPLNVAATLCWQALPLVVLGASPLILAYISAFTAINGMLQHANIAFKHGPLNYVFATADYHRWHHSPKLIESNTNYGSNIILWDIILGTRYFPKDRRITTVGLTDLELPDSFLVHLASPFILERYSTDEVPKTAMNPHPAK